LLHKLLGLRAEEEIFLAEESLEDLIALSVTFEMLSSGIDADRAIEISGDLGVAFHLAEPMEFWLLLTDRYSEEKPISSCRQEILDGLRSENIGGKRKEVPEDKFLEALVEYFAGALSGELLCESCSVKEGPLYVEDRIIRLESFLKENMPRGRTVLEIGCGSGMSTQALLGLGLDPWSMDRDKCDLCQGLKGGFLKAERSFVLDARLLGSLFPQKSFDAVLGFMVGMIDDVNWSTWKEILRTSSSLARDSVLYTLYTRKEAEVVAKAHHEWGWQGKIIDNRDRKGIYDQWAYVANRVS
jgi:hypothetical protein